MAPRILRGAGSDARAALGRVAAAAPPATPVASSPAAVGVPASYASAAIDELPDDVLALIMEFVGLRKRGPTMMRVCKRWARVALTEPVGFWTEFAVVKRLMLPMQERDWLAGRLRQLGRMAPLVRAFSAPAWRKLHDASAASGLTLSHFLEALDPASLMSLDLDLGLGSDAAVQLLPNFSCLDTLVLRDAEAPATPLVVASLADRLRTLRCHSGELLSASMLGAVQQLSGLTRLELAAQELGTASLAPLVHLTTLRCLTVREEMREADFLGALELPLLAQMSQLTSYSLLSKREDGMKVGGALLTGCSFTLGQHPSLGEVGVLFVRGVRQLESLDGTLDALLPAGKPLTLLELEHCQLTAQAMACCGRLAELPALDVNSCRLGGSVAAALEPLMRSTPKLEALTITGSLGLPNLPACVREKTGLKKLRLRQNALRDIMGGPFMHTLELLDISGDNMYDGTFPPAIACCTRLTDLDLSKSSLIRLLRSDVDETLAHMPALRRLFVSSITLTPVVTSYVATALPGLEVIRK